MENKNYCDNCSSELKVNAVFCENCGEKVSQKTKPRNVTQDEKIKKRLLHVLLSLSILLGVTVVFGLIFYFVFFIIFLVAFFKIKNTKPKSQSLLVFLYIIETLLLIPSFFLVVQAFSSLPYFFDEFYYNPLFSIFTLCSMIIFVLLIFAIYLQVQYSKILKLTIQDEIKNDTNFVPTPFCPHCGAEQDTGPNALKTAFCPHCGAMKNSSSNLSSVASDEGGFLYGLLGFFIPLAGFIIWVVSKETKPRAAKTAGTWALISVFLSLFMFVILLMIFFSYSI